MLFERFYETRINNREQLARTFQHGSGYENVATYRNVAAG
jgi:hypothetical protein